MAVAPPPTVAGHRATPPTVVLPVGEEERTLGERREHN